MTSRLRPPCRQKTVIPSIVSWLAGWLLIGACAVVAGAGTITEITEWAQRV
ncbi:hypothetical protein [Streptomyces sp. NPDC101455]|uniref:hypothetical protein n=1 Tax=Streptomyces sp. NPDC101455 TaxID=3366142 RepID=UPI0037F180C9